MYVGTSLPEVMVRFFLNKVPRTVLQSTWSWVHLSCAATRLGRSEGKQFLMILLLCCCCCSIPGSFLLLDYFIKWFFHGMFGSEVIIMTTQRFFGTTCYTAAALGCIHIIHA